MNGNNFVIVAYAIGLGLLWGYAALLWLEDAGQKAKGRGQKEVSPDSALIPHPSALSDGGQS